MPDYFDKAPVSGMLIKDRSFDPTTFVFATLKKGISSDIDGILGLEFLARYRFADEPALDEALFHRLCLGFDDQAGGGLVHVYAVFESCVWLRP